MALAVKTKPQTETRLRVLLDARKLGDGGIGVYIRNLVEGLLSRADVDLSLITKNTEEGKSWRGVPCIVDPAPSYSWDEFYRLGRRLPLGDFDIFHEPHYTLPLGVNIPSVITVHDITQIKFPEKFYYPWVARALIGSGIARASKVLTVSYSSFHQLAQLLGPNSKHLSKISVLPNALDPVFLDRQERLKISARERRPYFLCVISNLKPHKGLEDVLSAFEQLRSEKRLPEEIGLMLAGQGAGEIFLRPDLLERIQRIGPVECRGCVSKEELASLMRSAIALVVGSKAEGFCLPILEAKASGVPVICRPVPALLELVTDSDVVSSNLTLESFKNAFLDFLGAEELLRRRALRGFDASRYDRNILAGNLVDIYRSVLPTRKNQSTHSEVAR